MSSEVINIGKLMRQEAFLKLGPRRPKLCFKVSKKAVQEHISYLKAKLESDVVVMCEQARDAKRKTILPEDVVRCNGRVDND